MERARVVAAPAAQPQAGRWLQRKCACGKPAPAIAGACDACRRPALSAVRGRLQVGTAADPLEREADRVADQALDDRAGWAGPRTPPRIQRSAAPDAASPAAAPASVDRALAASGAPLEAPLRAEMEQRFGHDFARVRIHTGAAAEQSARDLDAHAYTVGDRVVFAAGRYRPRDPGGRRLLAHELAHVVQQSGSQRIVRRQAASAVVAPRAPTADEATLIEAARAAAAARTQAASMRLRGAVPSMSGRAADEGKVQDAMRARARSLVRTLFDWEQPNMDQVSQVVGLMVGRLMQPSVVVAAPDDAQCGSRAGYVRGLAPPIVLCPLFFSDTPEQAVRTMVHEAAHLAGIGSADPNESYCTVFDCVASCGGFDSADSWAHFVHCLSDQTPDEPAHVEGEVPADAVRAPEPPPPALQHDFAGIADRVFAAMDIIGTDEEAVYRGLQQLDRDPVAIAELMRVYRQRHRSSLVEDIEDEFSGEELEYALQLINRGDARSKQRIEGEWATLSDVTRAAERIRAAVEGPGTDEEAIYAVLLPFERDTLLLQRAYDDLYREDLRERLEDELSGSELEYALSLFEMPYERLVHDANRRLAGAPFGAFGDPTFLCGPDERETSAGTQRTYWYDTEYWEHDFDRATRACKVRLLPGKSAAAAIDAMFDHQDRWKISCSEFVQIAHLYALRHRLGTRRFDATVAVAGFTLEVKRRESTGLRTEATFARSKPGDPMRRSDTGEVAPTGVDGLVATAPIGSRVRWTNLDPRAQGTAWQNENTIKLGPDRFAAHGTASGVFTQDNTHSRAEVERLTAQATNPDADAAYIAANVFISEIEIFRDPGAGAD